MHFSDTQVADKFICLSQFQKFTYLFWFEDADPAYTDIHGTGHQPHVLDGCCNRVAAGIMMGGLPEDRTALMLVKYRNMYPCFPKGIQLE